MLATWLVATALAGADDDVRAFSEGFLGDRSQAEAVVARLHDRERELSAHLAAVGATDGLDEALARQVVANLVDKRRKLDGGVALGVTGDDLERRVVDYEAFKLEAYVTSGVFPKRYFGYLDERGDTVGEERRLKHAAHVAARTADAWLADQHDDLRVTDEEIAVTFLAESGALFLQTSDPERLGRLHPVFDVGLDDVATGFDRLPGLSGRLDDALGTHLDTLVVWLKPRDALPPSVFPANEVWLKTDHGDEGPWPYLVRGMTLEEAVAGTALMWVWEKRLAERQLAAKGEAPLSSRPLDEQFLCGSLVYNSGDVRAASTRKAMLGFATADRLVATSLKNAARRPMLPVASPVDALSLLKSGGTYPSQPTSWVAVYHVLQRYGAFVALNRFSDVFTADGSVADGEAAR